MRLANDSFPPIAIVGGVRTPFCRSGGPLRGVSADELGRACLAELLARLEMRPQAVDEVVVGCVGQPPDAMNIARVIALRAGIPEHVPAYTVHRNCASAFESITSGAEKIATGRAEVVVAGGVESMSNMPVLADPKYVSLLERLAKARNVFEKALAVLSWRPQMLGVRLSLTDGLTDKVVDQIMGATAENLAREFHISREAQDQFALESHRKTAKAWTDNRFGDEVMPFFAPPRYDAVLSDIGFKASLTPDELAKKKPYFDKRYGSVTTANTCPITDGAVMLLLMPLERALSEHREVLGVLEGYAYAGLSPRRMGLGPVFATAKLLKQTKLTLDEVDLIEINEAFAAQVLACLAAFESDEFAKRELGQAKAVGKIDPAKLNVNGGAIALGHPVGATGGRLVLTLLRALRARGLKRGLATLCVGGGMGGALMLSRDLERMKAKAAGTSAIGTTTVMPTPKPAPTASEISTFVAPETAKQPHVDSAKPKDEPPPSRSASASARILVVSVQPPEAESSAEAEKTRSRRIAEPKVRTGLFDEIRPVSTLAETTTPTPAADSQPPAVDTSSPAPSSPVPVNEVPQPEPLSTPTHSSAPIMEPPPPALESPSAPTPTPPLEPASETLETSSEAVKPQPESGAESNTSSESNTSKDKDDVKGEPKAESQPPA